MSKRNICFIGHLLNGKTTSAQYLIDYYDYKPLSFATDVKYAAAAMLTAFSETVHDHPREVTKEELEKRKTEYEVRRFLQQVGTEIGKVYFNDLDVWVRRVEKKLNPELGCVVIDDCRFPNEQEMLMRHNFLFVRVIRLDYEQVLVRNYTAANPTKLPEEINELVRDAIFHPSEMHINDLYADTEIIATDVEQLYAGIEQQLGDYIGR